MSFLKDSLSGMLIYTSGDSIAALISDDFSWYRVLGMMLLSGTLYTLEIPRYFLWIDKTIPNPKTLTDTFKRALLAMAFFNPLWIARHLAFIYLFSGHWTAIDWGILEISSISFCVNIPLSLLCNYLIQNRLELQWRYIASSLFSAVLAIYYALSEVLFGDINLMAIFTL